MSEHIEPRVNTSELASRVDENEMALGEAGSDEVLCPSIKQVAELYANAFVQDDDWEAISIDSSQSDEGIIIVEGQHCDTGAPFGYRLHVEDVKAIIEG